MIPFLISTNASGYANEVGEAFRYMIPLRLVHLSYGISSAYVMSHSVWCAKNSQPDQAPRLVKSPHEVSTTRKTAELSPAKAFLDTLIWQGLASVIVPGLFINRTCAVSRWIIYWLFRRQVNKSTRKWMVTGIGLGSIPFIIHPIDR